MLYLLNILSALIIIATVNSKVLPKLNNKSDDIIVNIPGGGAIQGFLNTSYFSGKPIFSFLGVPYAKPPLGDLRFAPPEPFTEWPSTVYKATKFRQRCPQVDSSYYPDLPDDWIETKPDSEDCLVLNIFTPNITTSVPGQGLPVFYYVHGGSFYLGSAYDFLPHFLLEKNIILVVPQYRLGVFGFFSLQTDAMPGNVGLIDVQLGLKWVQDNIRSFGGDPDKVTLAGQSAGAAVVTALLVSPLSKVKPGLFSQMIVQSGSTLSPWAVIKDPVPLTMTLASKVNCSEPEKVVECLKKVNTVDLINAHATMLSETGGACGIVVQPENVSKPKRVITKSPQSSFEEGDFMKIPIMVGTTRDEGTATLTMFSDKLQAESAEYFERNVTRDFLKLTLKDNVADALIDLYQNTYFEDATSFNGAMAGLVDMIGTFFMKAPTYSISRMMREHSTSYSYSFNFLGNVSKLSASEPTWNEDYPFPIGVAHSDELGYLFPNIGYNYTQRELSMVKMMVNLWTNFVIYGNPTPTGEMPAWDKQSTAFGPYYRIDESPKQFSNFFTEYEINTREGFLTPKSNTGHTISNLFPLKIIIGLRILFGIIRSLANFLFL